MRLLHLAYLFLALCYFGVSSCVPVPAEKLSQLTLDIERKLVGDSLSIRIVNPVFAPLEFELQSSNAFIERAVKHEPLVVLQAYDTFEKSWFIDSLTAIDTSEFAAQLKVSLYFSATEFIEDRPEIELPFPRGHRYRIIQAYNGRFSHRSDYSRYAIDFGLSVGDTICAVAGGYVVGIIQDYTAGGNSAKLRDYANYITIYHPEGEFYTQYVHLSPQGVLVRMNDWVTSGQAIALSGETGFTSIPHLHFNVLQPVPGAGPVSAPINFKEGYKGMELRKNSWVRKN